MTIARDERHLGAKIGFTAVLHTWGQRLLHHPHLHCVVPGGGLSLDGQRWIPARAGFFLPVRVLSRLFRKKYLVYLRQAYRAERLVLAGKLKDLTAPEAWRAFLALIEEVDWVVYAKAPFGSSEQVLKYLARYTHRVAISNRRLLFLEQDQVTFHCKDYRRGRRERVMRVSALEFMRRFLLHVLPKGFVRIRHYGFLSNRSRKEQLPLIRRLLGSVVHPEPETGSSSDAACLEWICRVCSEGSMQVVATLSKLPPSRAGPVPQ
ncbi:MAG: transposase [Rhodothermales bacterium]